MKYKLLIFLLVIVSIANSQSIRPLNYNLKGVLEYNNKIVAYGSGGAYLISEDFGSTWDEKFVNNQFQKNSNILKLFKWNQNLYGFTNDNRMIQYVNQTDDIILENTNKFLPSTFIDLFIDSLNLYILCDKNIITLNKNNEIIGNIDIPDSVKFFNNFSTRSRIYKCKNTFYISANKNKIYKIDNNVINIIYDFADKNQCTSCQLNNLMYGGGVFYSIVDGNLSISKDTCKTFLFKSKHIGGNSQIHKNNIINIVSGYNAVQSTSIYNINQDSIVFLKNDTSKYLAEESILIDFCILNDSTFLGVGLNKLITRTINKGENWDIISMFSKNDFYTQSFWINDSIGVCALKPQSIQYTKNAGKTWQPTKYSDELYKCQSTNIRAISFYPNGKGLFLINNGGNYNSPNIGVSSDLGNNVKLLYNDTFLTSGDNCKPEFSDTQNYIIDSYGDFPPKISYLIINDSNFVFKNKLIFQNSTIEKLKVFSDNHYQALCLGYKNIISNQIIDSIEYHYIETFNAGKSWDTIFKFNPITYSGHSNRIYSIFQESNTSGLFCINEQVSSSSGIAKIYRYSNDVITLINSDSSSYYVRLFKYKSDMYCLTYKQDGTHILKLSNNNWKEIFSDTNNKYTEIYQTQNKIYFKGVSNSGLSFNFYEFILPERTFIDSQVEDYTYFYSYPPYPIPAMNELKSLIYWDMSYNIDDSDIGVYDIYGNKIADREKISINRLNGYSGYLSWDCSGAGTGVYMIQIKHGTNTHNIRAMVVR